MNYTTADNRTPLNPGDVVQVGAHGKYIIDKYVACGGFALMYIAHEERLGGSRFVALKELFPRNLDNALVQRMEDGKILAWNPFALDNEVEDEILQTELTKYFQREVELTQKAGAVYTNDGQVARQNNLDVLKVEGPFTDTRGNVYLAIDTYMGEPLRHLIERGFVKNSSGKVYSNQHLLDVIDVLIETTIRLSSLHDGASMYHLDISPDNIYLAHSAGRTRYQPFIIDYGSAYDRRNSSERVDHRYTSNPFSSPEIIQLAELGANCKLYVDESSDTFSVASILFYAATGRIFTSELRFFDDAWKEQVQHAYSLGIPSVSRELSFADELVAFFKRGLATNQEKRYRSAKELVQALQKLKKSYQAYGNLLPLVEPDELMSYLVLQKHPLYEYRSEDGNIHVLCLGSGCFIKRMILSLISTGQMVDSHLFVHVVSKDAEQTLKSELCLAAPLLQEYSNILGHCDPQKEYVTFTFESVEDVLEEDTCRAIVTKYNKAHYYLISLGKNKQNIEAAMLYAKTVSNSSGSNRRTIINYYCSEEAANNYGGAHIEHDSSSNVKIDAFADDLSSYSNTIRTLGIRTLRLSHLYNKLSNAKATLIETAESLLVDRYGQRSSCASALHIYYKLASAGVQVDEKENPEKIIEHYREALEKDTFGKLLELEHRRWVMFMVADQYSLPTTKELIRYGFELVDGRFNASWKCTAKKLHPCLVPCNSLGITLTQEHWSAVFEKEKDYHKMEEAIALSDLDPLDQVSLKLRLLSLRKCRQILSSGKIDQMFRYIADKLSNEMSAFGICADEQHSLDVLQKELDATQQFVLTAVRNLSYTGDDGRLSKLQESFGVVSINIENEIQQLRLFLGVFTEYAARKDYKAPDATIINNLMWLVYSGDDIDLVKLQGNAIVDNIASALILDPKSITYIGQEDHPEWNSFLRKHKFVGPIDFLSLSSTQVATAEECLETVIKSCTRRCVIDITGAEETMIVAAQKVASKSNNVSLIRSKNDGVIENVYNFPTALAYSISPSLSADDVFTLHGASELLQEYNYMEHLGDFAPLLWNLYRDNQADWEMITAFFAHPRCSGSGIWIRNFRIGSNTQWKPYFRDSIPKEKWATLQLETVFCELEKSGFIRNVVFGENGTGKTVAFDYPSQSDDPKTDFIRKTFNGFFGIKIPAANSPFLCSVKFSEEDGYSLDVKSESIVDCFCKKEDYSDKRQNNSGDEKRYSYAKIEPILKQMEKMGLITKLDINSSAIATTTDIKFSYTDIAVKRCLVTAGNVLELYVWYQARSMRVFDDCAANFTFKWKEGVQNELDVILTMGLTTLVISCKTAKFNKEHLYEIKYLTEKFSVNSKPVIIYSSTLAVENGHLTTNLQPVKERARAMGVYLIDLNELEESKDSLGEKLVRIANNLDLP